MKYVAIILVFTIIGMTLTAIAETFAPSEQPSTACNGHVKIYEDGTAVCKQ